jgi:nucleoside 2-deoxyribosyltransferase
MNKKIYIASPFGFSEAGRLFLYQVVETEIINAGYYVLDPWNITPPDLMEEALAMPYGTAKREKLREVNKIIGSNNTEAIRLADGLLAVLDGVDIDSGTASEIGFAAALGKPIIGYRSDFRLSADNEGALVNLQVEYFIHLSGGKIVSRIDEVVEALRTLIR